MTTYQEPAYNDEMTVESLQDQLEALTGKVSALMQFVNDQFDACACEHCGHVHPRRQMLAVFGMDKGTNGKSLPKSSRWFCGYCVYAAVVNKGGNLQECRDRAGAWFATGYGRRFLGEMDSHFAHLGEGANRAPVAEQLRREFAAEITSAAQRAR